MSKCVEVHKQRQTKRFVESIDIDMSGRVMDSGGYHISSCLAF